MVLQKRGSSVYVLATVMMFGFDFLVPSSEARCGSIPFNFTHVEETAPAGTLLRRYPAPDGEVWGFEVTSKDGLTDQERALLSTYFKFTLVNDVYELRLDKPLDIEEIFTSLICLEYETKIIGQLLKFLDAFKDPKLMVSWLIFRGAGRSDFWGIKLSRLELRFTCQSPGGGFTYKNTVLLIIGQVDEFYPEFTSRLQINMTEDTPVSTMVIALRSVASDRDVNPLEKELVRFKQWNYLPEPSHDGKEYFTMNDTQQGSLVLEKPLDYELLRPSDKTTLFLNVSAEDARGLTTFATLTVKVRDVDDRPPEFFYPGCPRFPVPLKPCVLSYEGKIFLNYRGPVTRLSPGQVQARDMDNLNVAISYDLEVAPWESPDILEKCVINHTTGQINVVSAFEQPQVLYLVVVAMQQSGNQLTKFMRASLRLAIVEDPEPVSVPTTKEPGSGPGDGSGSVPTVKLPVSEPMDGSGNVSTAQEPGPEPVVEGSSVDDKQEEQGPPLYFIAILAAGFLFLVAHALICVAFLKSKGQKCARVDPLLSSDANSSSSSFKGKNDPSVPAPINSLCGDGPVPVDKHTLNYANNSHPGDSSFHTTSQRLKSFFLNKTSARILSERSSSHSKIASESLSASMHHNQWCPEDMTNSHMASSYVNPVAENFKEDSDEDEASVTCRSTKASVVSNFCSVGSDSDSTSVTCVSDTPNGINADNYSRTTPQETCANTARDPPACTSDTSVDDAAEVTNFEVVPSRGVKGAHGSDTINTPACLSDTPQTEQPEGFYTFNDRRMVGHSAVSILPSTETDEGSGDTVVKAERKCLPNPVHIDEKKEAHFVPNEQHRIKSMVQNVRTNLFMFRPPTGPGYNDIEQESEFNRHMNQTGIPTLDSGEGQRPQTEPSQYMNQADILVLDRGEDQRPYTGPNHTAMYQADILTLNRGDGQRPQTGPPVQRKTRGKKTKSEKIGRRSKKLNVPDDVSSENTQRSSYPPCSEDVTQNRVGMPVTDLTCCQQDGLNANGEGGYQVLGGTLNSQLSSKNPSIGRVKSLHGSDENMPGSSPLDLRKHASQGSVNILPSTSKKSVRLDRSRLQPYMILQHEKQTEAQQQQQQQQQYQQQQQQHDKQRQQQKRLAQRQQRAVQHREQQPTQIHHKQHEEQQHHLENQRLQLNLPQQAVDVHGGRQSLRSASQPTFTSGGEEAKDERPVPSTAPHLLSREDRLTRHGRGHKENMDQHVRDWVNSTH